MRIGANFQLRVFLFLFLFLYWHVFTCNGFWFLTAQCFFLDLATMFLMPPNTRYIETFLAAVVATLVNFSLVVWYGLGMFMLYVSPEIASLAKEATFSIFKCRITIIATNRFLCQLAYASRGIFRCGCWGRRDNRRGRSWRHTGRAVRWRGFHDGVDRTPIISDGFGDGGDRELTLWTRPWYDDHRGMTEQREYDPEISPPRDCFPAPKVDERGSSDVIGKNDVVSNYYLIQSPTLSVSWSQNA